MNMIKKKFLPTTETIISHIDHMNVLSQNIRGVLFTPLLKLLTKLHISANTITNARLLGSVVFLLLFFFNTLWATLFLCFLFFSDIVDGALARYQKNNNDKGKFLDILADHVVYMAILFALFSIGDYSKNIFYNTAIIPFSYILGAVYHKENGDSLWLLSPAPKLSFLKAPVVIAFFCFTLFRYDIIFFSLALSNILATILSAVFYIALQLRWRNGVNNI